MRVVFTVLDALPVRHLGADHTPVLHSLGQLGGSAPAGARAVMTSATYPNHATFATGTDPRTHGIVTNWIPDRNGVTPAWERGPAVPTLFDACRSAGLTSAGVFGDQHLVGVMGAVAADRHWPPGGVPPDGARFDRMGYVDDRDMLVELLDALDEEVDLVVTQINGPDTAAHIHGPDSEGAFAGYRESDALLAAVREHLAWDDTVWIIVSDHDQETVSHPEPVDLNAEIRQWGADLFALPEGNASVVCGTGAHAAADSVRAVGGVDGTAVYQVADAELECLLAWTVPGRTFGFTGSPTGRGAHGGPRTCSQVAVVTGGHAAVGPLARAITERPVGAADWAPTIAALFGVALPRATGRSLLG